MERTNSVNNGVGFWNLLQVALIVLKLCGVITCSWWLVMAPMIVGVVLSAVILAVCIPVLIIGKKLK